MILSSSTTPPSVPCFPYITTFPKVSVGYTAQRPILEETNTPIYTHTHIYISLKAQIRLFLIIIIIPSLSLSLSLSFSLLKLPEKKVLFLFFSPYLYRRETLSLSLSLSLLSRIFSRFVCNLNSSPFVFFWSCSRDFDFQHFFILLLMFL